MDQISYRGGYKYQLVETYNIHLSPVSNRVRKQVIDTKFICLGVNNYLTIRSGYAWDGPSGPTIDTNNFMRGSLIHDALYQLMREGYLNADKDRYLADKILRDICIEDGMSRIRAWYVYRSVRAFGKSAATDKPKKILHAPWLF